jgi:hypothetical protein
MPGVVTHRYDPARGMCLNICTLSDFEASQTLDRLRNESRPTLKPGYLARRRATEEWLAEAAATTLGRSPGQLPAYFFLGDFSYCADRSRPDSLVIPLASLPADAITFTLGDSMTVSEQPNRRMYKLAEVVMFFANSHAFVDFGLSDRDGFQHRFIEVQLWDNSALLAYLHPRNGVPNPS